MKAWLAILLLGLGGGATQGSAAAGIQPLRSVSGQFLVSDFQAATPGASQAPGPSPGERVTLTAPFLVVSCERIKQALAREIAMGSGWRDLVHVIIRPASAENFVPLIKVERLGGHWLYRVDLPRQMKSAVYFRTIIQVLLLELANRDSAERSAEIPLWLSEGLTQKLLSSQQVELVLPTPALSIGSLRVTPRNLEVTDPDPLARARQILQHRHPPTLAELSWPAPENFTPADAGFFEASAQLFVTELRQLQHGDEGLSRFVRALPRYFNWQSAFLETYHATFPNQLALEKWWALQVAFFVGHDHRQLWTPGESAQKLDELLRVTLAVRTRPGELPVRTEVPLQTVLREWDTVKQLQVVEEKGQDLRRLLPRVAPAYLELVDNYLQVLAEFAKQRARATSTFGRMLLPSSAAKAATVAIQKLDALDQQRRELAGTNGVGAGTGNTAAAAGPP
ncbi:MAG TPA: hypothetical protein PKN95_05580 [Verrucomicrobiota bacterium]|nr:hypothetical protein [Verrucomicrobiota bacterium]HNT13559.1 hypothetical protein [Verrucomicrobiota bacterium]